MAARNGIKLLASTLFRSAYSKGKRAPLLLDGLSNSQSDFANSWHYEPFRSITTSPSTFSLAKTLKEEVTYEKENYTPVDLVKSGPPAPFTLVEQPDDTLLTLNRKFGDETVTINLHVNSQPEVDMSGEGDDVSKVGFNVSVTKESKCLVFDVESDGSDVEIVHVSFEPSEGETPESYYHGPVFEELDDTLKEDFKVYLEARGVNADLAEYLRHLIHDKEQREYVSWLQKVHDFVKN